MERQNFKVSIAAPREKVWNALWEDKNYRSWTSVFGEGSRAETDWNKGSKVLFTDGKGSGMVSRIADKVPNEFMSFQHLGMVKDGVEDTQSEEVKKWAGGYENYTLKSSGSNTDLSVDIDLEESHKDFFLDAFPKPLEKVKQLAEN